MKTSKNKNYDSKVKESISTEKKFNVPQEKPDKTKTKQNDLSRDNDLDVTSIQKKRPRDINKDLMSRNEERINEELSLINLQTDDEEDKLDEEEESERNIKKQKK